MQISDQLEWHADRPAERVGSYSHEMRPDISIETLAGNKIQRIVLLDPKYRVAYSSLNQAMDDLHRYKDGIVGPDRQRLVHTALALCPDGSQAQARYFDQAYIQTHGLGAVVLRPGDSDFRALMDLLARLLTEDML